MRSRPVTTCALAAAAAAAFVAAVGAWAGPARAADWVVRPVRVPDAPTAPASRNVDVIVRDGAVSVGYSMPATPTSVYLSSLAGGETFFTHAAGQTMGPIVSGTSFAGAADGSVHFAYRASGMVGTGTDATGWGLGLVHGRHPGTSTQWSQTPLPVMAVDSRGIPSIVGASTGGGKFLSRFDVPSGQWVDTPISSPTSFTTYFQHALAFTPDDRAVVAYAANPGTTAPLIVTMQDGGGAWRTFPSVDLAWGSRGVSVAVLPDGDVAVAYVALGQLRVATYDGLGWTMEVVAAEAALSDLAPRSLTVDAQGRLAVAYAPRMTTATPATVHLARRAANGTWSDETLPVSGRVASVAFDAQNNPYVGVWDGQNVLLAGTTIAALKKNDLTMDGDVSEKDLPALVQAIVHPNTFLQGKAPMTLADVVGISDRDGDVRLTTNDARLFVDALEAKPIPGLADRYSGYVALDQADLDPVIGSGTGNFFGTVYGTGAAYSLADSRADVTGPAGVSDGRIDQFEVDLLTAAIESTGPADRRLDLNRDGVVDERDLDMLLHDMLKVESGDADVDGVIDADDFSLVDRGFAMKLEGWVAGDFNQDGVIDERDYLLLDGAYAGQSGGVLSPGFLAEREARFGSDYVAQLLVSIPEPSVVGLGLGLAAGALVGRRRGR